MYLRKIILCMTIPLLFNYYILYIILLQFNILTTFCGFTERMFDHNFPVFRPFFNHLFPFFFIFWLFYTPFFDIFRHETGLYQQKKTRFDPPLSHILKYDIFGTATVRYSPLPQKCDFPVSVQFHQLTADIFRFCAKCDNTARKTDCRKQIFCLPQAVNLSTFQIRTADQIGSSDSDCRQKNSQATTA